MVEPLGILLKVNWLQKIHIVIRKLVLYVIFLKLNQKFSPIFDELSCKSSRIQTIEIKILQIAF